MIGNMNGLRRTIIFVTLETRFSLTYAQTRNCRSLQGTEGTEVEDANSDVQSLLEDP